MATDQPFDLDVLVQHSDWVRRLARGLVASEDRADDVVQQTFLQAFETPPTTDRNLRGWLAIVARNVVRRMRTIDSQQSKWHRNSATPERSPSTASVVAKIETLRQVSTAVLGVREPYRTVLLMRYFHDLALRDIASRLGVPLETVRSQIKRGLAQLRLRLDGEHEGGRDTWTRALLAWVGQAPVSSVATITTGSGTALVGHPLRGMLIMSKSVKIIVAVVVLTTVAIVGWQVAERSQSPPHAVASLDSAAAPAIAQHAAVSAPAREPLTAAATPDESNLEAAPASADRDASQDSIGARSEPAPSLRGTVLNADRQPVPGTVLRLMESRRFRMGESRFREALSDANGEFDFPGVNPGRYELGAQKSGFGLWRSGVEVAPDSAPMTVVLSACGSFHGVVRDASGRGLGGVTMAADECTNALFAESVLTNEDGSYELAGLPPGHIWVRANGGARGSDEDYRQLAPGERREWSPTLGIGLQISGLVLTDAGKPLFRWRVHAQSSDGKMERIGALTDEQGAFTLWKCRDVMYTIDAGNPAVGSLPSVELRDVRPGSQVVIRVGESDMPTATIKGIAQSADGSPCSASIVLLNSARSRTSEAQPTGAFESPLLAAGTYYVSFQRRGQPSMVIGPHTLRPEETWDMGICRFPRPATLVVHLDREHGATGTVTATLMGEGTTLIRSDLTVSGDTLTGESLTPGTYLLHVEGVDIAHASLPVELVGGQNTTCEVRLGRGFKRTIHFVTGENSDRAHPIRYRITGGSVAINDYRYVSEERPPVISHTLAPGEYAVEASIGDGARTRLTFTVSEESAEVIEVRVDG